MSDNEYESCHEEEYDSDDSSSNPPKKKFKPNVLHENVAIKIDGKIYRLNRLQLELKSMYFEKLFAENFAENNSDVIEIRGLNSDTFSAIINLMNGEDLKSIMNADNYLALLMGMDYLQMEIDLALFESFVFDLPIAKVIELYNFLEVNRNYRYLEKQVLEFIAAHLIEIIKHYEEFILSLQFEEFFKIIRRKSATWRNLFGERTVHGKQAMSQICSKWICHDVENRIQHFTAIVHAVNYGFYVDSFVIPDEIVEPLLDEIKKDASLERIDKCFQQLLNYRGEINPDVAMPKLEKKRKNRIVNKIDETKKLTRFLTEGYLSDVTIKAGAKTYKLHRSILDTASSYFSAPVPTSDQNSEFVLDVDEKTFDLIVDFIYFDKIPKFDSNSKAVVLQILKAATILKSKLVIEKCCSPWMEKFKETLNAEDLIDLLNLVVGHNWQSESWVTSLLTASISRLIESEFCKNLFRLCQICDAAGITTASYDFRVSMKLAIEEMKYEDLLKAFDVICEVNDGGKYSYLYIPCLTKLIVAPKSALSVESHFLSVSCDILEDLLASEYFVIKDPQKIVDICSKWIVHDVENRYRLIPRIVFAINRINCMDFSDFESNIPADLSNCSQEKVNDELWKLLNSNCLIPRDLGSKQTSWDFKSRPMFILPKDVHRKTQIPKKVCIVDSELNEIVSLNFLLRHYDVNQKRDRIGIPKLSATLIGDCLFILFEIRAKFRVYAYNFSSKKLKVLCSAPRPMSYPMDTLLNCNNELFWCFHDSRVMKYSVELNRWLELYSEPEDNTYEQYDSDGKKLFRYNSDLRAVEVFDFERSLWTELAGPPSYLKLSKYPPQNLIVFRGGLGLVYGPAFFAGMIWFDSKTRSWREISTPNTADVMAPRRVFECNVEVVTYGEDLLYVNRQGIYQLKRADFRLGRWRLKKTPSSDFEFAGIKAIHSVFDTAS